MNTPVLLIHFNRPGSTRRQVEALKPVAPRRVWLLCDGPREGLPDEAEKVAEVRDILNNLPWECEVHRLYRDKNLGCFGSVSGGISWFLDDCGAGIILEDDVIPDPSFFPFCGELLEKYADAEEVFAIAGEHRSAKPLPIETDYGFSNYFECWGWATWKRAWDHFDPDLSAWRDKAVWKSICRRVLKTPRARIYWRWMFGQVDTKKRDSWAYRFILTIWAQRACVIIPRRNLTENIGFNAEGTQTAHLSGLEISASEQTFPLRHPEQIDVHPQIDRWFEDAIHSKSFAARSRWLARKMKQMFRKIGSGRNSRAAGRRTGTE